jgi:hypothetical protein
MNAMEVHLAAFAEAVTAGRPERFAEAVKAAYQAGACREDLLAAVGAIRWPDDPPYPVLAKAYAAIHEWYWMAARRAPQRGGLSLHVAAEGRSSSAS